LIRQDGAKKKKARIYISFYPVFLIIAGPGLIVDLHGQNHKKNTTGTVKQFFSVNKKKINLSLSKTNNF
jgi:hypothetical protein